MKMNCTVWFTFQTNGTSGTNVVGSYDPTMGHSSTLRVGDFSLTDDGKLTFPALALVVGAKLESGTAGSGFVGTIQSMAREGVAIVAIATGTFNGSQGSIMGGISCHCRWTVLGISEVSGRFGTFSVRQGDPLARYNAAKNAHRARFVNFTDNEAGWTNTARAIAAELGHHLDSWHVVADGKRMSPAQWADNAEAMLDEHHRQQRLERARRLGVVPPGARDVRFLEGRGRLRWEFVTA
jgi:hypothetical protein